MDNLLQFDAIMDALLKINNTLEENNVTSKVIENLWKRNIEVQEKALEFQERFLTLAIKNDQSTGTFADIYNILINEEISPSEKIKSLYKVFNIQK